MIHNTKAPQFLRKGAAQIIFVICFIPMGNLDNKDHPQSSNKDAF